MDLEKCLKEYSVVLTKVPGRTSEIHQIPYQIPMAMVNAEIVELWQFTVVIISKNDKRIRFCLDYRKLNQVTQLDPEPNAQIKDIIGRLGKTKCLSKVHLWLIS